MRTFRIALVVLFVALVGPAKSEETKAEKIADFFKHNTWLEGTELKRCEGVLTALVRTESPAAVREGMHKAGCFSRFEGTAVVQGQSGLKVALDGSVLFIRIGAFTRDVGNELSKRVAVFDKKQLGSVRDVVIDLVDNDGGNILAARTVMALFTPRPRSRFLEIIGTCGDLTSYQNGPSVGPLANRRYTILANEKTASASELVLAQLRFGWYPRTTTVIGVGANRTFGKSIMQYNDYQLNVRVTCGQWIVPHRTVQRVGIPVDREVPRPKDVCGTDCVLAAIKAPQVVGAK